MDAASQPLEGALAGLRVLDFSTLLPAPLATLLLAECGAEVIKIERSAGDATYPRLGEANALLGPAP